MKNSAELQITKDETQENNKLIAEFMGFVLTDKVTLPNEYKGEDSHFSILEFIDIIRESENLPPASLQNLKFDYDWNWLMPIVEKILNLKDTYAQERQRIFNSISPDINITYTAVISFIKWYNENK